MSGGGARRGLDLTREPDFIYTTEQALSDGVLIDPEIYGSYPAYRGKPVNVWTNGVRDLLRDYFASGQAVAPWGVLAEVLAVVIEHHEIDDGPRGVPPFAFRVPPFKQHPDDKDHESHPYGGTIWLEPNERDGWTALLPDEH